MKNRLEIGKKKRNTGIIRDANADTVLATQISVIIYLGICYIYVICTAYKEIHLIIKHIAFPEVSIFTEFLPSDTYLSY